MPDGRRPDLRPALLRAAEASLAWMESGISEVPEAIQALAVAALMLRRMGAAATVPLPLWAAWPALCAPDDPGVLPRLRGDTAARLAPDGASWPLVFLHLIAEARTPAAAHWQNCVPPKPPGWRLPPERTDARGCRPRSICCSTSRR